MKELYQAIIVLVAIPILGAIKNINTLKEKHLMY
jgi:hypothetical protein